MSSRCITNQNMTVRGTQEENIRKIRGYQNTTIQDGINSHQGGGFYDRHTVEGKMFLRRYYRLLVMEAKRRGLSVPEGMPPDNGIRR